MPGTKMIKKRKEQREKRGESQVPLVCIHYMEGLMYTLHLITTVRTFVRKEAPANRGPVPTGVLHTPHLLPEGILVLTYILLLLLICSFPVIYSTASVEKIHDLSALLAGAIVKGPRPSASDPAYPGSPTSLSVAPCASSAQSGCSSKSAFPFLVFLHLATT